MEPGRRAHDISLGPAHIGDDRATCEARHHLGQELDVLTHRRGQDDEIDGTNVSDGVRRAIDGAAG